MIFKKFGRILVFQNCKFLYWTTPRAFKLYMSLAQSVIGSPWTIFAPGKSHRFFELFLELSLFEFRFTVFFPLGCGVDSCIPHLQYLQTVKGKAPKEAWAGHLSG